MFRPMLAAKMPRLEDLRYPLFASYKMDGIRAVMRDGVLMSRSMKPIPNAAVQEWFRHSGLENFDGELIVGQHDNDVYRRTMSAVMSHTGDPTSEIEWCLFDYVHDVLSFRERLKEVKTAATMHRGVASLKQMVVNGPEDVLKMHMVAVQLGYEGLILRDPAGLYKQGRSTAREQGMIKVKMFEDSEAEILGFRMLMHNANEATASEIGLTKRSSHKANMIPTDRMGAIKVRDIHTGVEFEIGTGFTDEDRRMLSRYNTGRIIKYKFFAGGVKDKPRFPVFLGFRDHRDL